MSEKAYKPKEMNEMLVINEDNSHFFGSRTEDQMTLEGLHAFVNQYADTCVTHLFLCPNAMRASFRSESRDAIWDPVNGVEPEHKWPKNAKLLHERGLDPYFVWIERCRERGISPWLTQRMNDIHSVDERDNFMHSTFWRENPEYWRVPEGSASPWQNRAMNYAHPEVRDHQMAFVRELLDRYDPDGIELDWMRFGYHLTPGKEDEEGPILTAFVRKVRELTVKAGEKRGHPVLLSARVPAHPDAAKGLGMDGVLWAREGLVDLLVPCPFWSSSDFDIPVELWLERLGDAASRVEVAPGIEHNARPWPGGKAVGNDLASLVGFVVSSRYRGAKSLYLFNWMDSETRPVSSSQYGTLLTQGLGPKTVLSSRRRHPVCYRDTVPPGVSANVRLPIDSLSGEKVAIPIGPKPTTGEAFLVLGLAKKEDAALAKIAAFLNGQELVRAGDIADLSAMGGSPACALRFTIPLDVLRDGHNEVQVRQTEGPSQQIVWMEIEIKP